MDVVSNAKFYFLLNSTVHSSHALSPLCSFAHSFVLTVNVYNPEYFFMFKIWSTVTSACVLTFPTTTPHVTSTTTENSVTATRAL